nr:hypothetical protein [Limobrevibacterium gyesilva]
MRDAPTGPAAELPAKVWGAPDLVRCKSHIPQARSGRNLALATVLGVALGLRLWVVLTHTYIIFQDETFQYLEQAHRLAFGSGVVPWEFIDGIRSWLLPGMIALVMRLTALVSPDPSTYVLVVRICVIAASLSVPYVGFRMAEQRCALPGAVAVGLLCAFWFDLVYFAPAVLTEVMATYAAFWAIWLGDVQAGGSPSRRRLMLAGALFGLACCLRYQYAPALALAALWQHGRDHTRLGTVLVGTLAALALTGGLLDTLTWGAPFQSVWLNFSRNAVQGVGAALGVEPWYYFPAYFSVAWNIVAPLLLGLMVLGATRMPALAFAAVATVALHSMTPHKEMRFIFLASAAMPVLIGLGTASMLQSVIRLRRAATVPTAIAVAVVIAGAVATATATRAYPANAWHRDRSVVQAFDAARSEPNLCGLGVRTLSVYRSGGYTYLHRDVPIYFETFEAVQQLETLPFRLRLRLVLNGQPVPQYPNEQLARNSGRFNFLIGRPGDRLPGFETTACFGAGSPDDPAICVFRRPGGCD